MLRRRWRWLLPICVRPRARREARLVVWGAPGTRGAEPGMAAGEVMAEHDGHVVCRADGFLVGRPAPALAVGDRLEAGRTYVVVPADRLPGGGGDVTGGVVTAASLAALSSSHSRSRGGKAAAMADTGRKRPFEYAEDGDGRTVIKVAEEFVVRAVAGDAGGKSGRGGGGSAAPLCSTPELRKHYEQLVGAARGRPPWSPRLDTIKERKGRRLAGVVGVGVSPGRLSPVRLLGMHKDKGVKGIS